jgi:hypothetical protein
MQLHVTAVRTNVSEERITSIIRVKVISKLETKCRFLQDLRAYISHKSAFFVVSRFYQKSSRSTLIVLRTNTSHHPENDINCKIRIVSLQWGWKAFDYSDKRRISIMLLITA